MAVTHVDLTHRLDASIDYATKGKPHVDDAYIQGKRALEINSVNASCNPKNFKQETHAFLKHNIMNRKGNYTGIRTIISFDPKQLDYRKLSDRHKALAVGTWVAKHKYPHNQSLIVLQADNKHHILHDHIITCARRLDNNHSATSGATFQMTVPFTNQAERYYGLTPYDVKKHDRHASPSHAVYRINQRHEYSFVQDVHDQIINSFKKSNTLYEFEQNLQKRNIHLRPAYKMRTNRKTHKHEYHFYKYPTNKGYYLSLSSTNIDTLYRTDPQIAKNSNLKAHKGEFLKLKKHFTYTFINSHGKRSVIRDRKLGSDTFPDYIDKTIKENRQKIERTPDTPSSSGGKGKKRKYTLSDLQPTHQTWTENKESLGHTHNKIGKYWEPRMYRRPIKEPVMNFQPKTHSISKALDTAIYSLNRIAQTTKAGTSERQRQMEMFEEKCEFDKKTAKKIEANEENKEAYYKVQSDNRAYNELFREHQFQYNQALKREQWKEAHFQGPSLF